MSALQIIVAGSTGLCGSAFTNKALHDPQVSKVWSFSRSDPELKDSDKLKKIVSSSTDDWIAEFPESADVFFSGIATTRAAAGGLEKQKLIDHDLQVKLATAAKEKGCKTAVLISSSGANSSSFFGYMKMKGETEEAFIKLGFERTIILRPGMLLGKRTKRHDGYGGSLASIGSLLHRSPAQGLLGSPIYADEVATGALHYIEKLPKGVHYIGSRDLLNASIPK